MVCGNLIVEAEAVGAAARKPDGYPALIVGEVLGYHRSAEFLIISAGKLKTLHRPRPPFR